MAFWKEWSAAWIGLLPGPDPIRSRSLLFVFGSAMDKENKNLVVRTEERYSKAIKVNNPSSNSIKKTAEYYMHINQI